jgi:hypothetical protein
VQLARDRADRPAFGVMQAKDLRLHGTRDHGTGGSGPASGSSAPVPRPLTGPHGQRRSTERAALERTTELGARLALAWALIARWTPDDGTDRDDAPGQRDWGSLMRHYRLVLSLPLAPPALPRGVSHRAGVAALVARLSSPQRLTAADPRAPVGAIQVAVIAALADPHLHLTALAVVEPVRRPTHRPQCRSPSTGQRRAGQA